MTERRGAALASITAPANLKNWVFRNPCGYSRWGGPVPCLSGGPYRARMRDRDLYAQILGITSPWHVSDVRLDVSAGKVEVVVEHRGQACCPQFGKACPGYHARLRRWRHLDTCQLQTVLVAQVPRVECPDHGVVQASTPWAEAGSRFTALFERVVIDWLREASFSAVARRLGLTWDEVDGIMARAVERGLARRDDSAPARIGLDETSFQKRHE